jgi:hypothetical protein
LAKRRSQLHVLFASGYAESATERRSELDREVNFLAKPYRKSELARMIRHALQEIA